MSKLEDAIDAYRRARLHADACQSASDAAWEATQQASRDAQEASELAGQAHVALIAAILREPQ